MLKIRRRPLNALDDLGAEKLRRARDLLPAIERAQEVLRLYELDSLAPILKAAQRQQDLLLRAGRSLNFTAPALGAVEGLTLAGDGAAAAIRTAMQVDFAALDVARNLSTQMDAAQAAAKTALQIDTSAFDAAGQSLTLATSASDAMKHALRIDTSVLDLAHTLAPQIDAAASIRATLAGSGVIDQIKAIPDFAASWRGVLGDLNSVTNILPSNVLANIASMAESLHAAMPAAPIIDPGLFGAPWNDTLNAAVARLRARAEQVANNPEATAADVEALAAEAEAVTASAPASARPGINQYFLRVLVWLMREARDDVAKYAIYRAAGTLIVILTVLAQPQPMPPPAPPPPTAPTAPGGLAQGLPGIIRRAGPEAEARTLQFLASVRNRNTRDAYVQALVRFTNWCEDRNLELAEVTPFTINAYVNEMERDYKAATVRQHLAAIRLLFDHLVAGGVVPINPTSEIRGPKGAVRKRNTAALQPQEIRRLLGSIDVSELSGLRDRALIAVMVYGLARVSALVAMDVKDYTARGDERWLRLHEKDGRPHEVPTHRKAQEYLNAYLQAAGIAGAPDFPLWRTMAKERALSGRRMSRVDVYRAVRRRADDAELGGAITCQNLRAAGLTAYLGNGGTVKRAQAIAAHASPRTTRLYEPADRDEITAADVEKIGI
jgi:integrase/recombinase XerD